MVVVSEKEGKKNSSADDQLSTGHALKLLEGRFSLKTCPQGVSIRDQLIADRRPLPEFFPLVFLPQPSTLSIDYLLMLLICYCSDCNINNLHVIMVIGISL